MIHQFEPYRASIPRDKSSPRSFSLSQPIPAIPCVSNSQPFPTTPVVPKSQPTPSLLLVQPNPIVPIVRPILIAQPFSTISIKLKEELDMANPNLVDQEPTQIKNLEDDNPKLTKCCIEEVYEADLTLVEKYDEENFREYDITVDSTLPEETLGKDQVIKPSSEIQEQPKINENQVSLV